MEDNIEIRCHTCKFWFPMFGYPRASASSGECRYNAPVVTGIMSDGQSSWIVRTGVWPEVEREKCCGRYDTVWMSDGE